MTRYHWTRPQAGESRVDDTPAPTLKSAAHPFTILRVTRSGKVWTPEVYDGSQWWHGGSTTSLTLARQWGEALLDIARGEASDLSEAGL